MRGLEAFKTFFEGDLSFEVILSVLRAFNVSPHLKGVADLIPMVFQYYSDKNPIFIPIFQSAQILNSTHSDEIPIVFRYKSDTESDKQPPQKHRKNNPKTNQPKTPKKHNHPKTPQNNTKNTTHPTQWTAFGCTASPEKGEGGLWYYYGLLYGITMVFWCYRHFVFFDARKMRL